MTHARLLHLTLGLIVTGLTLAAGLAHSGERMDTCSNPPGVLAKPNPACKVTRQVPAKDSKQRPKPDAPGKPAQAMLPGLGLMPGEKRPMMANVVRVTSHYNEVLYVSSAFPNRVSTPFAAPKLIDNSEVEWQVQGQSLYLSPKLSDKPVGIFVTGAGVNDPVVSLTLIPRNIPAQTIILQLDEDRSPVVASDPLGESEEVPGGISGKANSYTDRLRGILRSVVLGKTPVGFAEGLLPVAVGRMGMLLVMPEKRYSGQYLDVFRYRVENVGPEEIELSEPSFYRDGVRAVSIYPIIKLRKGMSTSVFVLSDKAALVEVSIGPAETAKASDGHGDTR